MTTPWWTELKNVLLATLIAGLVWVWAEGESVSTRSVVVVIDFPADAQADLYVRPDDAAWKGSVRVRLEGSIRNIESAAQVLGTTLVLRPGLPGMPTAEGEKQVVDLREALGGLAELQQLGNPVAEIEPRSVIVQVTRMVSREVPVRAVLAREIALDGEPVVNPLMVTIRMPAASVDSLVQGEQATAWVSEEELGRMRGEGKQTLKAVIRPPASLVTASPMFVVPDAASVTIRVRTRLESINFSSLPVWIAFPPGEDPDKWSVALEDRVLENITVTGSSDDIARLRSGATTLRVMLTLSRQDLADGISTKAPEFVGLPPSMAVSVPKPECRLKIQARNN